MAKLPKLDLEYRIEPFVKLTCFNFRCVHNLANWAGDPEAACNLKRLVIEKDGTCKMMIVKDKESDVSAK